MDNKLTPIGRDKSIKVSKKLSLEPIDISQLDNIIQTIDNAPVSHIKSSIKILSKILKDIAIRL